VKDTPQIILRGEINMAQKMGYEVEGEVVTSLKDLAPLLGVSKVTSKDIAEGGQYSDIVSVIDLDAEITETEEEFDKDTIYSTVSDDEVDLTPDEVLESMPEFENLDELKEFIKDLDTPTLEYLAKGLKLKWTPTYHGNIHRMRIAMAMHRYFFPDLFKPTDAKKKKAKYADYSTEDLEVMAKEAKVEYKESDNEAINRMRVIMALKESGQLDL